METKHLVVCDCTSLEHIVVFDYEPAERELYIHVHLSTYKSFWKRLWIGLKYTFGYKSKYGEWDEVIVKKQDCKKIRELLLMRESSSTCRFT